MTLPNREVLNVGPSALAAPPPTNGHSIGLLKFQGLEQGSAVNKHNASSEILGFSFGSQTPTNSRSGGASGKRQHSPITIVKEVDSASPSLFQALVDNEALKTIQLSFTRPSKTGQETVYQRITLTNATIVGVERYTPASSSSEHNHTGELESISFSFQKIEVTNINPK